jgi:hypothetical protein
MLTQYILREYDPVDGTPIVSTGRVVESVGQAMPIDGESLGDAIINLRTQIREHELPRGVIFELEETQLSGTLDRIVTDRCVLGVAKDGDLFGVDLLHMVDTERLFKVV